MKFNPAKIIIMELLQPHRSVAGGPRSVLLTGILIYPGDLPLKSTLQIEPDSLR